MEELPVSQIIEATILAADGPVSIEQLIDVFEGESVDRGEIKKVIKEITESCSGRGYELTKVASGYRFQIRSDYSKWVSRLWKERTPRYSRALLETLALIAYKQPITRGDIEEVRGVSVSSNIIRTLVERDWIKIVGHRDVPGRPALYSTTKAFLDYFNLERLDQLPSLQEIRELYVPQETNVEEVENSEDQLVQTGEGASEAGSSDNYELLKK